MHGGYIMTYENVSIVFLGGGTELSPMGEKDSRTELGRLIFKGQGLDYLTPALCKRSHKQCVRMDITVPIKLDLQRQEWAGWPTLASSSQGTLPTQLLPV